MFKRLSKTFMRGALTVLPLALTVYFIFWLVSWTATTSDKALHAVLPDVVVFPGAGLLAVVALVYAIGVLMGSRLMRRVYGLVELPFKRLPIVRDLYIAIKQLADYLRPSDDQKADRVVLVQLPDTPGQIVGLLMRDSFDDLPEALHGEDKVAVYLPMSYQIGGFTVFIPRGWVTPVDMGVDEAMRGTLTGWAGNG